MVLPITILDEEGNTLVKFDAQDNKSFADMAEDNNVEIPTSCRSGACFVCAAKVKQGMGKIDIGKLGVPLVDIEEDEVLTCIAGIKSEFCNSNDTEGIILQKI